MTFTYPKGTKEHTKKRNEKACLFVLKHGPIDNGSGWATAELAYAIDEIPNKLKDVIDKYSELWALCASDTRTYKISLTDLGKQFAQSLVPESELEPEPELESESELEPEPELEPLVEPTVPKSAQDYFEQIALACEGLRDELQSNELVYELKEKISILIDESNLWRNRYNASQAELIPAKKQLEIEKLKNGRLEANLDIITRNGKGNWDPVARIRGPEKMMQTKYEKGQ